ncbi:hypothetical protein [Aggregatibacter actinomycetemcomitans]|uniref:hypothetical protein n=1 Tax=Aggregatibacter actinomycetemcomitans TaxID=714 RepID=UPI00023FF77F|nr:hypothetical protein [Aggregatibacter actinomycetemcomitans]EHK89492.1 excinuclease ABC subunit A [Aggregatibacter actinomycetemcomitans RhAA1]KNE76597.1 hypothetical protein RHAA2_09365 [Aggregatibacter actinomycetemcomitans RhAA1]
MKLVKTLSVVAVIAVLSACSASKKEPQPVKSEKTVVYSCNKRAVTVTYQFENQEATEAKVVMRKKVIAESLPVSNVDKDFPSFISDKYIWSVDSGFSLNTATATDGVMLTQRGKKVDRILAKNCKVNAKATARANQ